MNKLRRILAYFTFFAPTATKSLQTARSAYAALLAAPSEAASYILYSPAQLTKLAGSVRSLSFYRGKSEAAPAQAASSTACEQAAACSQGFAATCLWGRLPRQHLARSY